MGFFWDFTPEIFYKHKKMCYNSAINHLGEYTMKPKRLLMLLPVLPLSMLCACGGTIADLSFNANWYRNTSLRANLENTLEQLEYSVTFEENQNDGLSISYTDGVYKTELKNGQVELDNSKREGYLYTTDLSINVCFEVNGNKSEVFTDNVHTEVQFLSAADGLRPVKSYKKVSCHAPITDSPSGLSGAYEAYSFTYSVEYDDELTKAEVEFCDLLANGNPATSSFTLKGAGSFLDNEQILFALRGVDLSYGLTFRSINTVQGKTEQIAVTNLSANTAAVDFEMDGERVQLDALEVNTVSLSYSSSNVGQPQTLVYAKTTDSTANIYRNVLLEMKTPVYYSLGTLNYKLVKATFTNK